MGGLGKAALAVGTTLVFSATAVASESVTYTYDELGRLVAVSTTGGPNGGAAISTSYDRAGNRTNYGVTGAGAAGQTATVGEDTGGTEAATLQHVSPSTDIRQEEPRAAEEEEKEGEPPASEQPERAR